MSENPCFDIGLPKWPAMVVVGEPVTREQAAEILIRTDGLYFSSNDREFERQLYDALDVPMTDRWPDYDAAARSQEAFRVLDLEYLHNARIVSSWIGGPHGWCSWDGCIESSNYNIGKWPGVREVLEEWQTIARAFPYLRLQCELWSGETSEKNTRPLVRYAVADGRAVVEPSVAPIGTVHALPEADIIQRLTGSAGERGCNLSQFRWALQVCRQALAQKPRSCRLALDE